jgi:hypothetical protein
MRPTRTAFTKAASAFLLLVAAPALADEPVVKAAGSYVTFQEDVAALEKAPVTSGKQLDAALDRMAGYSPDGLAKGFISFAALNAAQAPAFGKSLNKMRTTYGDEKLFKGLRTDLNYASRVPGAGDAVQTALNVSLKEGAKVTTLGESFEQKAYSLQKTPMKNEKAGNAQARVAQLKAAAATGKPISNTVLAAMNAAPAGGSAAEDGSRLLQQISQALKIGPDAAYAASPGIAGGLRYKPEGRATVDRMVTLAAYESLGAGESRASETAPIMLDPKTRDCLDWTKLHLNQCVSASRFKYEHAFCLGRHALKDVGACLKGSVQ